MRRFGYAGLSRLADLTDASSLSYDARDQAIVFSPENGTCYQGLLVFQQGSQYGVLRFIDINADAALTVEYWIGDPGITDFRNAP